jgi:hypothetical protein
LRAAPVFRLLAAEDLAFGAVRRVGAAFFGERAAFFAGRAVFFRPAFRRADREAERVAGRRRARAGGRVERRAGVLLAMGSSPTG